MGAIKYSTVHQVVKKSSFESIRHMLLATYKEADLKTKVTIKPILDRFNNDQCISPRQLSYVASLYIRLVGV